MLYLVNQEEYLKATFGNPKYYKKCGSNFACGTPMENDENTQWFKEAPNPAKAKELFQKAGYDGRPVVVLHATNIDYMNNAAQITAQRLREIGVNVAARDLRLGRRRHAARRQDAARPGRLEHLHHLGRRRLGRQSDRARRPRRDRREGLVRLALERDAREAARQMGRRRDAGGAEGGGARDPEERLGLRAPSSGSGSGSRRSPTARTSRASSRSRRSSRSGTSRRPERRAFKRKRPQTKNARREPGVLSGPRPRYCTRRGPPSAGFSFSPRMPRRRATSE